MKGTKRSHAGGDTGAAADDAAPAHKKRQQAAIPEHTLEFWLGEALAHSLEQTFSVSDCDAESQVRWLWAIAASDSDDVDQKLREAAASLAAEKLRLQRQCGPKNQDGEGRAQARRCVRGCNFFERMLEAMAQMRHSA